ncbi:hypothetical protein FOZ63_024447 [Perkinsus olseni]|uniref:Uncharacterized protein n=1 Tax=Perkinsus olseni TaxID=32597 RepID=A0A7J6U281_PEROL|nr:hypothetical protein FOZ63_024447 [Perkinsus olseni]
MLLGQALITGREEKDAAVQTDSNGEVDRLRTELAFERRRVINLERQYTRSEVDRLDLIARTNTFEIELRRLEQQLAHDRDFNAHKHAREDTSLKDIGRSILSSVASPFGVQAVLGGGGGPTLLLSIMVEAVCTGHIKHQDYCWVEIRLASDDSGRLIAAGRTHGEKFSVEDGRELSFGGAKLEMTCQCRVLP